MKKFFDICKQDGALGAWIVMIVSIALIISSFILPPTGVIDPSVLAAVGELGGFGVIFFKLPYIIKSIKDGKSVSLKYGNTEVAVSAPKKAKDDESDDEKEEETK